ncbi:DUF7344 domain-containing protein [Halalkalicoccus subterraneus]|uniref:DUF7344 domain-containing protein n=1 Tax=Halalkalicoccus subterraneus TaxID=2675002 RepID=UPI000EFC4705|nr:hypothetical protein [Halalkalicoccus subterraneus]
MSKSDPGCGAIVSHPVPPEPNRHRWYVLRYLGACTYPASVDELAERIAPRVGGDPATVAETIRERDLPALADCGAIEYDAESRLACLPEQRNSVADCARQALVTGTVSHHRPPRLDWLPVEESDPGDVVLTRS